MQKVCFLTGVTGFLGQEILARFAADPENRFTCLIRRRDIHTPQERLEKILAEIGIAPGERIKALEGDIRLPKLGLQEETYRRLLEVAADAVEVDALEKADYMESFIYVLKRRGKSAEAEEMRWRVKEIWASAGKDRDDL